MAHFGNILLTSIVTHGNSDKSCHYWRAYLYWLFEFLTPPPPLVRIYSIEIKQLPFLPVETGQHPPSSPSTDVICTYPLTRTRSGWQGGTKRANTDNESDIKRQLTQSGFMFWCSLSRWRRDTVTEWAPPRGMVACARESLATNNLYGYNILHLLIPL